MNSFFLIVKKKSDSWGNTYGVCLRVFPWSRVGPLSSHTMPSGDDAFPLQPNKQDHSSVAHHTYPLLWSCGQANLIDDG